MNNQPVTAHSPWANKYFSHFIPHMVMHLEKKFIRMIGDRLDSRGSATSVMLEHCSWAPAPTTALRKQDPGLTSTSIGAPPYVLLRVLISDRCPVTAGLRYRYTDLVWPVTGRNRWNSNLNSNGTVQPVRTVYRPVWPVYRPVWLVTGRFAW